MREVMEFLDKLPDSTAILLVLAMEGAIAYGWWLFCRYRARMTHYEGGEK